MVKHALRSVLVITGASLLFSCGVGSTPVNTKSTATATKVSMSSSLATIQPVQCSDGATIAANSNYTVGIKADGTVMAVGYNNYHQLDVSSWTDIKSIAAGVYHTVGLKSNGTVTAVGAFGYDYGQLDVSKWTDIKAIAAGMYHTVGLKSDGTVTAVGYDYNGSVTGVSSWTNIKAIAAGQYHTVGLKTDGTIVVAGKDIYKLLTASSWTNIQAIAAGWYHTVGLKSDGTVTAVGYNFGQLNVSSWTNIKAIAAGEYITVGLKSDGTVTAVGSTNNHDYGQLSGISPWTDIQATAVGVYHTVGLKSDGTVVTTAGYPGYGLSNASNWTHIMPLCPPASPTNQDVTPPTTISMVTGTMGNNGWYVSDVQITLTATDNEGGSGVKEIHYTVDGTEAVVSGSTTTTFSIVSDGTHTVTFYAIDNAGNVEIPTPLIPLEEIINIDQSAPTITGLGTNSAIIWPPNHKMVNITIGGSVADSGSGIASATITVTDEYGVFDKIVSGFGSVVALEAWRNADDMDGRVYTITAVVTDNVGHQTTGTTTVVVPHDMR